MELAGTVKTMQTHFGMGRDVWTHETKRIDSETRTVLLRQLLVLAQWVDSHREELMAKD